MTNLLRALAASAFLIPIAASAQSTTSTLKVDGVWIFHANLPPQAGNGNNGGIGYAGTARFASDGSISGTSLDQHTASSFGQWAEASYHQYNFTFLSDTYDAQGNYANTNRVRGVMILSDDGLTATGTTLLEILDKTGAVVFKSPATSSFTGTRVVILPLP
jgi:hypothetical protein